MNWELLLWIVPAYVANSTATLSKFFPKRHPVDLGYVCKDGRRLLGNGKTWEGIIVGTTLGTLAGWPFFWYFHIPYNAFLVAFGALLAVGLYIRCFCSWRSTSRRVLCALPPDNAHHPPHGQHHWLFNRCEE